MKTHQRINSSMEITLVDPNFSIVESNNILENSKIGMVFVVEDEKLLGCVTAGDIRRALLNGAKNNSPISTAMNVKFVYLTQDSSPTEIHNAFTPGIKYVPLLDASGRLLDLVAKDSYEFIPLSEPNIGALEKQLVNETLDSNWISSTGNFVTEFESKFANYIGSSNCVTVSNGTVGLVLALKAFGVGIGDEVIVPSLTFGATANAVLQVGGIPIFVDIDPESWCMEPNLVGSAITNKTKAIIPVHLYGHAADLDKIKEVIGTREIVVIEDAAEAVGTTYKGKMVGSFSDASVFSFFANKTITTGEGGMVSFRSEEVASIARRMRSHGFSPVHKYQHDVWGSNFRLTNMQAALGVAQLERVEALVERKRLIAGWYKQTFNSLDLEGIVQPPNQDWNSSSFWLYSILLPKDVNPTDMVAYLQTKRIESRRVFSPLHSQPYFLNDSSSKDFLHTNEIFSRGLSLPSSTKLVKSQIEKVCYSIQDFLQNFNGPE